MIMYLHMHHPPAWDSINGGVFYVMMPSIAKIIQHPWHMNKMGMEPSLNE